MPSHVSLLQIIVGKKRRTTIAPRKNNRAKTPSSPSHPSPACTINRIIRPHQVVLRPASAALSAAAMRWRGMEGFVVREPFEMRARGGVVALLLRDDGSTRKPWHAKNTKLFQISPSLPCQEIRDGWVWTSSSTSPGRVCVVGEISVVLSALVRGSGLAGIYDGGSGDVKARHGRNRCEFPQFHPQSAPFWP